MLATRALDATRSTNLAATRCTLRVAFITLWDVVLATREQIAALRDQTIFLIDSLLAVPCFVISL